MKHYYKILQIDREAEPEVVQAAYRRLAAKYHPDHYHEPDGHERMVELNEAYETLSDPEARSDYDWELDRRGDSAHYPDYGSDSDWLAFAEEEPVPHSAPYRWAVGVLVGWLTAVFVFMASTRGLMYFLNPEEKEHWGLFFWGHNWLWRLGVSAIGTAAGSSLAAVIVRRKGEVAGALVALPGSLGWAVVAYLSLTGQTETNKWQSLLIHQGQVEHSEFLGNRILAIALAIGSVILGYVVGQYITPIPRKLADHFDSRRFCLLGVKWYHLFWLPLVLYATVMTTAYGAAYGIHFLIANWGAEGFGLWSMVVTLLMIGYGYTVYFCFWGIYRTYLILARLDEQFPSGGFWPTIRYGCGFPLLAALGQTALGLIQWLIAKYFG